MKECTRFFGVTNNYCPACKVSYFQTKGEEHSVKPSPSSETPSSISYEIRTLKDRKPLARGYLKELASYKNAKNLSDYRLKNLRRKYENQIDFPVLNIKTKNIAPNEFHTVLNKAKRLYRRVLGIARLMDGKLKALKVSEKLTYVADHAF